jgi:Tfp pilus assembly protein PilV
MVALFIVVAGLTAAALFFASMARAALFTENAVTATGLAQAKIEELIEEPFSAMSSGQDSSPPFNRTWSISGTSTWARINSSVSWVDISGNRETITLTTIRTP